MRVLEDEKLLQLVEEIDRKLALSGVEPKARSIEVPRLVCRELGILFQIGGLPHPEIARIRAAHKHLYRNGDMQMGAVHSGLTFFLDIFFIASLPIILGSVRSNILNWTDASPAQKRRIFARQDDVKRFVAGIMDVADAGACLAHFEGFTSPEGEALRFFRMACYHNQAMAATLRHAFDYRGGIQAALLCAEMAVKSGLAHIGWTEEKIRKVIGHKLHLALPYLDESNLFNTARLQSLLDGLPDFVASRYDEREWPRTEVIDIAERSQAVLGEISRSISGRSFASLAVVDN